MGTFWQVNAGSGQRPQGGQAGQLDVSVLDDDDVVGGATTGAGQLGQTGGTTDDFKMYKSSSPGGIIDCGIPGGSQLLYCPFPFMLLISTGAVGPG